MLLRTARAVSLGCLVGCAGGLLTALADFGAHWLWLESWRDRGGFLLRLLGLQTPAAMALGAGLGLVFAGTDGAIDAGAVALSRRTGVARERLADGGRALRVTLLLAPGLIAIGILLFSGGSMSRLSARSLLQSVTCVLLLLATMLFADLAYRVYRRARARPTSLRGLGVAALIAGFALAKLNQWVLPKLYDYLHGALGAATLLLFMIASFLLIASVRMAELSHTRALLFAPALALALPVFSVTLGQLDENQNVSVGLLHPNAPHARSLLQALAPYLIEPAQRREMLRARQRARLARAQRGLPTAQASGPVLEDAHILLVTIDALRADHLGAYGYTRDTSPHLDRLARESLVFERAYAPAPHSSYSLCSLMTSEYLHETLDLGRPPPQATLPTVLAEAGYHTAAFYSAGIFHTAAERLQAYEHAAFGFALNDRATYPAEELTERALQEVDRTVARGEPSSLFWVHYFDVHEPYRATHFGSSDMDRYDSEIRHVDAAVDALIRGVRERLRRDVIVVISSDHGEEFHEHGGVYHGSTVYEEQVRVPLIVNARGLAPGRVAAAVSTIDIAPTLLGLLGMPVQPSMRGGDLRQAASSAGKPPSPVFSAVIHKKMVVRWPHKLIADLRFGLFELYDLQRDPRERDNLADRHPELVNELRLEIYGWLDSLAPAAEVRQQPLTAALDWGRLGDRRAVEPLSRLVAERSAPAAQRVEAARMLGHLADEGASASLVAAMGDAAAPIVAAEAAIALGRMYDPRARTALRALVRAEDVDLRIRAAVSLGRLRDREAVPALIEALWIATAEYERHEAVRWLGRLRDPRALEPLIAVLPDLRGRFLVVAAIGQLGDRRAFERLAEVLSWDNHANVRDSTLQGLGWLGDPRAVPLITPLAAEDPSLKLATESLVRLGALQLGAIGGTDVAQETGLADFSDCYAGPVMHDWDYLHRSYCLTRASTATLALAVPEAVSKAEHGVVVVLSAKRSDAPGPAPLQLSIGPRTLEPVSVDGSWDELRWTLPAGSMASGTVQARVQTTDPASRFAIDHLLLLPRASQLMAHRDPRPQL